MDSQVTAKVHIEDEMRQSFMDYAMSVIVSRALPDVRDGLKPVQRRVLYAMLREGLTSNRKTAKCAGVVGSVLKSYHPHGDMPVYEALVRLAQPWNMRYPLVDGQGNFGSVDGDPPAAYRYTECRMTALAEKLLADIDKETVDFVPNFDDTGEEPLVLPSLVPNLLVNGVSGIAVGMATHIPPHNLGEVLSGAIALIKNPRITVPELMEHIPGPDFPTGGTIQGRQAIALAYAKGRGIITVRAKCGFEQLEGKSRDTMAIVITEIPYQVNKARLIEKIAELVQQKTVEGISKLRDESDRSGMRIVVELKRDATPEVVLNQLYKHTPLQTSFGITSLAIVDGKPVVCTLVDLLTHFIDHRRDVVVRRTQFELKKARERMHLLEGFRIALLNLDEIIALIRGSETPQLAKDGLISRFQLSEIQAQAILDLRLQKLTGMERLAVEQEHAELGTEIDRLLGILSNTEKVDEIIMGEIEELRAQFNDARRTVIEDAGQDIVVEDLIEDEEMVVTISHQGFVKRTSASEYRAQRRGGKGVAGASIRQEDFVTHLFVTSALSNLLVLSTKGRAYSLKVYEIPEAGKVARGRALINLVPHDQDEGIAAVLPIREFSEDRFLIMCTAQGIVKRTELMDFAKIRRSGIVACTLRDGDRLVSVGITHGADDIVLVSRSGMAIRFSEDDVRSMGRTATGVRGMSLESGDSVVGMTVIAGDAGPDAQPSEQEADQENRISGTGTLFTVCERGYGKRTALADYRQQGRGGKGLIDIRTSERNGPVISICAMTDESEFMLITSAGKIIRSSASDISVIGRNTQGVRLINLEEGERVVALARLEAESEDGEEEEGAAE